MDKRASQTKPDTWRMKWISQPLLKLFKKVTPSMSQTEREALDAGSVWWDGELFSGKPKWKKLLAFPAPALSAEEQAFIDGPVNELCKMIDDWDLTNHRGDLPQEVWQFIKDNGFLSMIIPKEYGGLDYSNLAHSEVVMKVATRSISAAVTVMVPNSLGPGKLILEYGTKEQKDYYLPRLAKGQEIPCFALTAPDAGSDAGSIPDYGIVCKQDYQGKKDVLGMRLNWNKRYITLGPVATLLGLAFKLYDPDHLLGDEENLGITLALIPTDIPGVDIGRRHMPLNMTFMNGPNYGKDVFVPLDSIIGGPERAGQGWRMLMECLSDGRGISLPALSVGAGKLCSRVVGAYSRVRRQFKMPIGRFEGVEEALARIGGNTYMMDAARTLTLSALDLGEKPSVISAIVKYHLTESMRKVVNDAMDIQGGAGICLGPRNLIGRGYQALPISITVEGANILTRSMIIFGQGAIRSHPYIFQEMEAMIDENEAESLIKFDRALMAHIYFVFRNFWRTLIHGLTAGFLIRNPGKGVTRRYYQKLTRMSAAFALVADMALMMLGGSLKRKEKLSGRLGDVLSELYLASAILKRFEDQGRPKEDVPLLRWSLDQTLYRMQMALYGLLKNMPMKPISLFMIRVVFPWGRPFSPPSDRLGHEVANLLLNPSEARDRLTKGMYMPDAADEQVVKLEDALQKVIQVEEIEKRMRNALREFDPGFAGMDGLIEKAVADKVITRQEADAVRAAEAARSDVIQVDDFPLDLGKEA
ncbi:MAG: acyl-CoA dehydrogenase [Gammaproteobacteria bacterium]|nr:acyl-CoA dehydrogenase [Gammaproteobacteria bacterium]MDH5652695.1 acyl-CoA dehydrogenase [Gammaproteobacteria bacterium]